MIFLGTIFCYELKFFALRSVLQVTSFELSKNVFVQFVHHKGCRGGPKVIWHGKKSMNKFLIVSLPGDKIEQENGR